MTFWSQVGYANHLATQTLQNAGLTVANKSSHLGYRNGMILAILSLYVATMPPIKFQLNLTYGLREICRLKIFKTADMVAILDIGMAWF